LSRARPAIAALALVAVLAVAGCGSGGEGGAYGSGGRDTAGATTATPGPVAKTSVSIQNLGGDVGRILIDSAGFTLYFFEKDGGGESACYGNCAQVWPPLIASGPTEARGGVTAAKLGTTERDDGTLQVTYAGWPLYTYEADRNPGEANGADVRSFGATWYPLHPDGEKAGE
jgi:predicted lipoprotein with Yx(FWY)xxD motif